MNLQELMDAYHEEGLTRELAASRVCQDIVLKAIAEGPLSCNVTIKGGVVMRSLTKNNRRATRDIDLDFMYDYLINNEELPDANDVIAEVDIAWPFGVYGIQRGYTKPVALRVDATQEQLNAIEEQGFTCFTDIDDFKAFITKNYLGGNC